MFFTPPQWLEYHPRPRFEREVIPNPLRHDSYPISESNEEKDVDETPKQPSDQTREMETTNLRHCLGSADRRQRPSVRIYEWLPLGRREAFSDHARNIPTLLHGHRCEPGQGAAVRTGTMSCIADDENPRVIGDR
jgi:hypothetical protein